ncbi:MAG: hypothetical protein Kow0069_18570 [Promethearchaeota archaeon]
MSPSGGRGLERRWAFEAGSPVTACSPATTGRGLVAVGTRGGTCFVLDPKCGDLVQEVACTPAPAAVWDLKLVDANDDGGDELVTACLDGRVRVHSLDGQLLWEHKFGSSVGTVVAGDVTGDGETNLVAASLDRTLRVLSGKTGELVWGQVFSAGVGPVELLPGGVGKMVLAGGNDGTARAYSSAGELAWAHRVEGSGLGTPMVRFCVPWAPREPEGSTLLLLGADGAPLTLLDAAAGQSRGSLSGPEYPWTCAVACEGELALVGDYVFGGLADDQVQPESGVLVGLTLPLNEAWTLKLDELHAKGNHEGEGGAAGRCVEAIREVPKTGACAVGTSDGVLFLVDGPSGRVLDNLDLASMVNCLGVPSDGSLVAGTQGGLVAGVGLVPPRARDGLPS